MKTRYYASREQQLTDLRQRGWRIVTFKTAPVVVAYNVEAESGKVGAKAWSGKADKPAWYYSFRNVVRAEAYVAEYIMRVAASEHSRDQRTASKAAARASLKASDHYAVGDVIYNSWGYDQTNIDWYQVVEVKAKSIVIREIAGNSNDHGGPSGGRTAPRRNDFCGKPMLKPLDEEGRISFKHGAGSKWDGKAKSCSSYH